MLGPRPKERFPWWKWIGYLLGLQYPNQQDANHPIRRHVTFESALELGDNIEKSTYSKTSVKGPIKNGQKKGLNYNW